MDIRWNFTYKWARREKRSFLDSLYLTALGSTRSEIIVPVFDAEKRKVIGTLDVESERQNAFGSEIEAVLEACSEAFGRSGRG
jgi:putative methionine-R-sulfoxide reductase with GAF domain